MPAPTTTLVDARRRLLSSWLRLVLFGVVMLPMLVGAVGLLLAGWWPLSDLAYIGTRSIDVWSSQPPVLGMRSTSGADAGGVAAHHPGPLEFYVLAVPMLLTGFSTVGMMIGTLAVNGYALWTGLTAAHDVWRRPGMCVAAAAFAVLALAIGGQFLLSPWNPITALFPLVALLIATGALLADKRKWSPHWAFLWSYVVQAHLGYIALGVALAVVVGGVTAWRAWQYRDESDGIPRRAWVTVGVLVVCWLPVVVGLFTVRPNNLTRIVEYLTASTSDATIGWGGAITALSNLAFPTSSAVKQVALEPGAGSVSPVGLVLLVAVVVAVALAVWRWATDRRDILDRLVLVAAGGVLVGWTTIARIAVDRGQIYALLFLPVFALATTVSVTSLVRASMRLRSASRDDVRGIPLAGAAAAGLLVLPVSMSNDPVVPMEANGMRQLRDAVVPAVAAAHSGDDHIRIEAPKHSDGAPLDLAPEIGFGLSQRGISWSRDFLQMDGTVWSGVSDDSRHENRHAPKDSAVLTYRAGAGGQWTSPKPAGRKILTITENVGDAGIPVQIEFYYQDPPR